MLHHLMFVDPTLSNIGCSTSSNDIGPTQSNIVSPFITQHWLYCSSGSVWTKRDRFYLIKADSTVYIILRGGEGLLDISDLCLAIKWRLNGTKAESNTKKTSPCKIIPCVFATFTLKGTWQYARIPVGRNQTPCLQQTGSPSADYEQPSTGVEIQPHSRTNINNRGTV